MAEHKSEKSVYLSEYGGGYVRPDQWVTEKLCENVAKQRGAELPDKFWKLPEWDKFFRRQVALAATILKSYDPRTVAAALRDRRSYRVRSFIAFTYDQFQNILKEHQKRLAAERAVRCKGGACRRKPLSTKAVPQRAQKQNRLAQIRKAEGGKS